MISKGKAGLVLIVVFTMIVNFTAQAFDQDMTRHIESTDQDIFVLETGVAIDANFMTVLSPDMDIRGMLFFEDIKINSWEVLINATLRLRTFHARSFDAESKITIYGIRDYGGFGYSEGRTGAPGSPSAILGLPLTDVSVNYNTSQFYGSSWKEIDVTSLVNEMKNDRHYDGPGSDSSDRGDDMIFMIFGAEGHEPRSFYDFRAGNNLEAQLVLHWTDSPPPPPGGAFNESYRGLNIFVIDHNGANRTGEGFSLNWNNLNMTELTETDPGNDLTLNTDTWLHIQNMEAVDNNAMYNDTGAPANITSFFVRLGINVTSVTNNLGAGSDRVFDVASVSTATPVGGGGLLDGLAGDQAGLFIYLADDDVTWRFRLIERSGAAFVFDASGPPKLETDGNILYVEFVFVDDGIQNYIRYQEFSDETFQTLIRTSTLTLTQASGPMRYPKVSAALSFGTSRITAEFYTFLDFELAENKTWVVAYENGTTINECPSYDCAIIFVDDLLGVDPAEPEPKSQGWEETGPFTRFKTRFYILLIGVVMVFGPLFYWSMSRPSGYEFVIGAFIMFVGFALMYAAGQV